MHRNALCAPLVPPRMRARLPGPPSHPTIARLRTCDAFHLTLAALDGRISEDDEPTPETRSWHEIRVCRSFIRCESDGRVSRALRMDGRVPLHHYCRCSTGVI